MLTMVVPASPPSCPPMSLAWINTWYSSFTSLSILGKAVFITPGVRARFMRGGGKREGIQSGGKKEVAGKSGWDIQRERNWGLYTRQAGRHSIYFKMHNIWPAKKLTPPHGAAEVRGRKWRSPYKLETLDIQYGALVKPYNDSLEDLRPWDQRGFILQINSGVNGRVAG